MVPIVLKKSDRWLVVADKRYHFTTRKAALLKARELQGLSQYRTDNDRRERTVDLLRARRSLGIRARRRRLPKPLSTRPIEREYSRALLNMINRIRDEMRPLRAELPELLARARAERFDVGEADRVRQLLDRVRNFMEAQIEPTALTAMATQFAERTRTWSRRQFSRQVQAALGTDLLRSEGPLRSVMEGFVAENVSLIRSIPQQMFGEVEQLVTRGIVAGTPNRELQKEISERFEVSKRRARVIARDQIGKLNGQLNAKRQKDIGVTQFIWRSVQDERVRNEHQLRNGQIYNYSDPPDGELPGEPIQCRCYAEPVFGDILENL